MFAWPKFTQATHSAGVNFQKRNFISTLTQILLDTRKYCRQAFSNSFVQLNPETKMSTKQTRIKQEQTQQLTVLNAALSCLSCLSCAICVAEKMGRGVDGKAIGNCCLSPRFVGKVSRKEYSKTNPIQWLTKRFSMFWFVSHLYSYLAD